MKTINIGLIGHGFMGHEHESMLSEMEGIRLVGISDKDTKQLNDVKDGIRRYTSNKELMEDPEVQVVLIAVNNNQHRDLVIQAAEAGKDIICEKPVAMNVQDLDEMISTADKYGVKFTVHQQRRLDKDFQTMKCVFESGKTGNVYTIQSRLFGFNGNMHDWHVRTDEGGGMLFDWGVHLLDQMLYLMPEAKIKTVFADMRNIVNKEVDDYFNILLKFDNGITAQIELGTYFLSDKKYDKWFERHWIMGGDQGTAYSDGFDPQGKIVHTHGLLENAGRERTMTAAGPTRSFGPPPEGKIWTENLPKVETKHADFFANYKKAYKGEEDFLVKVQETRRVLSLMEIVRKSAELRKSLEFE